MVTCSSWGDRPWDLDLFSSSVWRGDQDQNKTFKLTSKDIWGTAHWRLLVEYYSILYIYDMCIYKYIYIYIIWGCGIHYLGDCQNPWAGKSVLNQPVQRDDVPGFFLQLSSRKTSKSWGDSSCSIASTTSFRNCWNMLKPSSSAQGAAECCASDWYLLILTFEMVPRAPCHQTAAVYDGGQILMGTCITDECNLQLAISSNECMFNLPKK